MTRITITDYKIGKRFYVNIEKEDLDETEQYWKKPDKLLMELQDNYFFEGKKTWSELTPSHYRLLISRTLNMISVMEESERTNNTNPIIKTLRFLLTTLIYSIEIKAECVVEVFKISRVDDYNIIFDYSANMNIPIPSKPSQEDKTEIEKKFVVIVDNDDMDGE